LTIMKDNSRYLIQSAPAIGWLPERLPPELAYPFTAIWSGMLYIPEPGPVRLEFGGTPYQSTFDGQPGLPSGNTNVRAGWHRFNIEATLDGPTKFLMLRSNGDGSRVPIRFGQLWPYTPKYMLQPSQGLFTLCEGCRVVSLEPSCALSSTC
jgi:hypothetical protein